VKIIISGHEYSMATISKLTLWDTIELEKQTGLTVDDFSKRMEVMAAAQEDPTIPADMFVIGILVWLTRRKAGENLTLEQACDFPLDDMQVIEDETDQPAADPQPA